MMVTLKRGYSYASVTNNIVLLVNGGTPKSQAVAIALTNARSTFFKRYPGGALPAWLAFKDGKRMKNPVPPSSNSTHGTIAAQKGRAEMLYHNFTGHEPSETQMIDKPVYPDVMSVIGDIDGVMYTTIRDGVTEKYIHKFKKNSRPLFCVAPDGQTLYMIGGSYEFGERGIVDK